MAHSKGEVDILGEVEAAKKISGEGEIFEGEDFKGRDLLVRWAEEDTIHKGDIEDS